MGWTLLCIGLLAALLLLMPGRWADVEGVLFPPPPPTPIPREPHQRAQLAIDLTATGPTVQAFPTLWKLVRDEHHYVRGQALEALAAAAEGARMDPRRAETIREIAADDTDWNRRSACKLLVQRDPLTALPLVAELWFKTTNANTKSELLHALSAADKGQDALVRAAGRAQDDPIGRFAREVLPLLKRE